jgi:hypothetical protein
MQSINMDRRRQNETECYKKDNKNGKNRKE